MVWGVAPWMPFRDLEQMRREMDRLLDSFFERRPTRGEGVSEWLPILDISETKGEYLIKVELPGIDPKEIEISLTNDLLTIKGEKKQEKGEEETVLFAERGFGPFNRTVRLSRPVESDKINANFKNGLLTITLPKTEEAKKKEIKIKVE